MFPSAPQGPDCFHGPAILCPVSLCLSNGMHRLLANLVCPPPPRCANWQPRIVKAGNFVVSGMSGHKFYAACHGFDKREDTRAKNTHPL